MHLEQVSMRVPTLKKRSEFVRCRSGRRANRACLSLQCRANEMPDLPARAGYTVTTKTGNSVERSRIKRRLRDAVRRCFPEKSLPGHDYVLIGKREALTAEFAAIVRDLNTALDRVHETRSNPTKHRKNLKNKAKQD